MGGGSRGGAGVSVSVQSAVKYLGDEFRRPNFEGALRGRGVRLGGGTPFPGGGGLKKEPGKVDGAETREATWPDKGEQATKMDMALPHGNESILVPCSKLMGVGEKIKQMFPREN